MARISGSRFIELLTAPGGGGSVRIPTGPWQPVDLANPRDFELEVADSVDLRGRKLSHSLFVHGVRFRGRVDLRNMTVEGGVDLTACVFDEDLLLDDAEVQGSLLLTRISTSELSLMGLVVRGSLDLSGCGSAVPIVAGEAQVDGTVDLRAVGAGRVQLRGAHIGGDLRIGCLPGLMRSNSGSLREIDACGCEIEGSVRVDGAGSGDQREQQPLKGGEHRSAADVEASMRWPEPNEAAAGLAGVALNLNGSEIGGDVQVMPFFGQPEHYDFEPRREYPIADHGGSVVWPVLKSLDLAGATIRGNVTLFGALVSEGVDARNAHIGRSLRFETGRVYVWSPKESLYKDCLCRRVDLRGSQGRDVVVDLEAAQVDGDVSLLGAHVRGTLNMASVTTRGPMICDGWLWHWPDAQAPAFDVVLPTVFDGDVLLYLATLGSVLELCATVRGRLSLWSVESRSYVRLRPFWNLRCEIRGIVDLHSAHMRVFEMQGAVVDGHVRLDGCDILRVCLWPGRLKMPPDRSRATAPPDRGGPRDAILFSQIGQVTMRSGRVAGDFSLAYAQITGRARFNDRGLLIEDSEIGGKLEFLDERAIVTLYEEAQDNYAKARGGCPIDHRHFSAAIIGDVRVRRSKVHADVEMSALKVDGVIDFEDSTVGGDLRFKARLERLGGDAIAVSATCRALKLRMAKFNNDVDLTGLRVLHAGGAEEGCVSARFVTVSGDLRCVDVDESEERVRQVVATACIEGQLDLAYSKLTHLVVSADAFAPGGNGRMTEAMLVLERARLGKFEIKEQRPSLGDGHAVAVPARQRAYPGPIKLADVTIETWEIEGSRACGNEGHRKYTHLLANANDEPFRRSTYRALESHLRNRGEDEYADALYRAMFTREWRQGFRRLGVRVLVGDSVERAGRALASWRETLASEWATGLRRLLRATALVAASALGTLWSAALRAVGFVARQLLWQPIFRWLLRYGTNPAPLALLMLALLLVMLPAYKTADNFEASLPLLAVQEARFKPGDPKPARNEGPAAGQWGWGDAWQVALKNHVPIVPLQARDDWQPKDGHDDPTLYPYSLGFAERKCSKGTCTGIGWAPEDLFNFVQLFNWICWPILLTFLIRRLLRQA